MTNMAASKRVGFIGGGQLARMTAQEAAYMMERNPNLKNLEINILDPTTHCPAHEYATHHIVADFKDPDGIKQLADISDVLTYEIELGNAEFLIQLRDKGLRMYPSPETLQIIQDKFAQKSFLKSKGIPVTDFAETNSLEEMRKYATNFGYPCMLKTRRDAYDGRGNFVIKESSQLEAAYDRFKGRSLMLERFVNWEKEISVIAARGESGELATYPVGENMHIDNILEMTIMPARVNSETAGKAEKVARKVMEAFGDRGVFGIEMFVYDSKILVNEVAPRVHNSGHGTLEKDAFETSQFEQHLRAISDLPLGNTHIKRPVVMRNILGDDNGYVGPYRIENEGVFEIPGAHLHIYGKEEVRPKRKIGHISVVGNMNVYNEDGTTNIIFDEDDEAPSSDRSLEVLVRRANFARQLIKIVPVDKHE